MGAWFVRACASLESDRVDASSQVRVSISWELLGLALTGTLMRLTSMRASRRGE